MEYYHLVTRIPMHKGQIIDFSNGEHNRLYEFWMKRENRTEDGRDTFDILNEKRPINDEENQVLASYVFCQSRAVRETITELVRVNSFAHLPSRFSCLYVCDTIEKALKWKHNFEENNRTVLQLVKLLKIIHRLYMLGNCHLSQNMKYAKLEQMSESNTEDDSAYEEARKDN